LKSKYLWIGVYLLLAVVISSAEPPFPAQVEASLVPEGFRSEPGWLRSNTCLAGPNDSAVSSQATVSKGMGYWFGADTLQPIGGLGSVYRLRVKRNGLVMLRDQDFQIPTGDSILIFAESVSPDDIICLDKATTPLLVKSSFSLYRRDQVPVFHEQELDSSLQRGSLNLNQAEDTAYAKYRLNYSGSKSMSVNLGSGGGLGLDASLFINLNGQVAEDVFIEGQLSDQNVPIQPEGNTATLKEVDTKFMRVFGKHYAYTLGNYLMDYGVDGEDQFTAKVEGVNGAYSRGEYGLRGSWSIGDGQYQSDTLRGVDGKQRGYYLRGRDGRQFITVLAGTERIWRNGLALKRGVDYTIDYSEGRLDFLPSVMVTGENLFSTEYQYTEQDFQRSLASGEIKDRAGPVTWSLRSISELENKDRPLTLVLDSNLLGQFAAAGDNPQMDSLGHILKMPARQSSAAADLAFVHPNFTGKGALLFSQFDRNLYSDRDDENNLGYSTRFQGRNTLGRTFDKGGWGRTDVLLNHEYRTSDFESFKQLIEPRGFLETWNLDARIAQRGFLANRIILEERPFTRLLVTGELGRADADATGDLLNPRAAEGSESKRASLGGHLGGEKTFVEASTEAKLARSPDRRDNYRQHSRLAWEAGGFTPSFAITRNEWVAELPRGSQAQSIKEEPELTVATMPFFGKVSFNSGLYLLSQRGNFAGVLTTVKDSVHDIGLSQKVEAIGIGPWNSDFFYSFHNHQQWRLDAVSAYAETPEENNFHQVEWNNHVADRKFGYGLTSAYRISRTAEFPLVDSFAIVKGRGNYIKDTALNVYHLVESGGDYVLIGLMRDTTVGSRPYQDLSWSANLELTPAKFPLPVSGFLSDIEMTLDLAMDHQDTSDGLGLLPLFMDAQIEKARSGRSHYSPALHWKAPVSPIHIDLYVDRTFSLAAGIYAAREKLWNQRSAYRQEVGENWEYGLDQSFESRRRQGLATGGSATSKNENYAYGARAERKLPKAFSLEGRGQYLIVNGSSVTGPIELQGVKPAIKLEKSSLYNGRAFLEYGVVYFWGVGDGGYYTTGEFVRGLTHRMEANANFQIGENMYLNFDYIVRLEPGGEKLTQKFTAEARAVF
jgi:hypothetical protein